MFYPLIETQIIVTVPPDDSLDYVVIAVGNGALLTSKEQVNNY